MREKQDSITVSVVTIDFEGGEYRMELISPHECGPSAYEPSAACQVALPVMF